VDAGTSGGIWGLKEGYSLMIGGDGNQSKDAADLPNSGTRSRPRLGTCRARGAGHFVKMVHKESNMGSCKLRGGFAILKSKQEFQLDLHASPKSGATEA